jgi:hypothetical protein
MQIHRRKGILKVILSLYIFISPLILQIPATMEYIHY